MGEGQFKNWKKTEWSCNAEAEIEGSFVKNDGEELALGKSTVFSMAKTEEDIVFEAIGIEKTEFERAIRELDAFEKSFLKNVTRIENVSPHFAEIVNYDEDGNTSNEQVSYDFCFATELTTMSNGGYKSFENSPHQAALDAMRLARRPY